jgi:hypothetical protein
MKEQQNIQVQIAPEDLSEEHFETIIIGGGQTGLSVGMSKSS